MKRPLNSLMQKMSVLKPAFKRAAAWLHDRFQQHVTPWLLRLWAWAQAKAEQLDAWMSARIAEANPYDLSRLKQRPLDPITIEESPIRVSGSKFIIVSGVVFLLWAFWAPLDQGLFVQGNLAVAGNRKQIQHPTGGVVTEILVKEGQEVEKDQVLIRMNPLGADANFTGAQLQYLNLLATEARLRAERLGKTKIEWPARLTDAAKDSTSAQEAMEIQQKLFETRRLDFNNRLEAQRIQVQTLTIEAKEGAQLAKEGYMSPAQASGILRSKAAADAELSKLVNGRLTEIDGELAEVQKTKEAVEQKVQALAFDASLNSVRAPVAGVITGLKVNTVGGVVNASQPMMEVVPRDESLVVEVRIPTTEAAKAQLNMEANLRFVSLPAATTPVVYGRLVLLGADKVASDKLTDINPNNPQGEFYIGRIELTPEAILKLSKQQLSPGMPVEVVLKTGERSFMSYLFKPLFDSFAKAFLQ